MLGLSGCPFLGPPRQAQGPRGRSGSLAAAAVARQGAARSGRVLVERGRQPPMLTSPGSPWPAVSPTNGLCSATRGSQNWPLS